VFAAKINDLGGRRGNAVQAVARWRHPVASSKAWDVLNWAMCPALYRCIRMAIKIASNLHTILLLSPISLLATTVANYHVMVDIN
jgi:hypothetical protein